MNAQSIDQPASAITEHNQSASPCHDQTFHPSRRATPPSTSNRHNLGRKKSKFDLGYEYNASLPSQQFKAEQKEERRRLAQLSRSLSSNREYSTPSFTHEDIEELVRDRWKEEGIWDSTWEEGQEAEWRWRHERPCIEPGFKHLLSITVHSLRDPSRPISRFLYQVHKEIRKIWEERMETVQPAAPSTDYGLESYSSTTHNKADITSHLRDQISSQARRTVGKRWERQGLWNDAWGELPGLSWKHEQPMEEFSFHVYSPTSPGPFMHLAEYALMDVPASKPSEEGITKLTLSDVEPSISLDLQSDNNHSPPSTIQVRSESETVSSQETAPSVEVALQTRKASKRKRDFETHVVARHVPKRTCLSLASPQKLRRSSRIFTPSLRLQEQGSSVHQRRSLRQSTRNPTTRSGWANDWDGKGVRGYVTNTGIQYCLYRTYAYVSSQYAQCHRAIWILMWDKTIVILFWQCSGSRYCQTRSLSSVIS